MVRSASRENDPEAGYILLAVIFLTVILLVSLAIAAPKIAISIQRDKEMETIHRGEQYKRALKLYYQKYGSYPTSVDQLKETNQIRFLRKVYADPLTGKADWKPVLFGQAHVRPLGFFGQPLMTAGMGAGASMYAVAASTTTDANGVPIATPGQSGSNGLNGASGFGSGSSFGSSGSSFGSSGSGFGSSPGGSSPTSSSMFGSPTSTSGPGSTSSPFGSSGTGTSATSFGGGGPIVGFTLTIDKPSLIEYKLQTRYNKWEFNYDPMEDQAQAMAGLAGGANPTGNGTPASPFGGAPTSPGSLPTNPNSGPTSSPTPSPNPTGPTDPTAPQ